MQHRQNVAMESGQLHCVCLILYAYVSAFSAVTSIQSIFTLLLF